MFMVLIVSTRTANKIVTINHDDGHGHGASGSFATDDSKTETEKRLHVWPYDSDLVQTIAIRRQIRGRF